VLLYEYDIASAYPAIASEIPTMKDGAWELVENPTREDVFNASPVSMFEVKTHDYSEDLPFYALPFRTKSGAIMFPPIVWDAICETMLLRRISITILS
jgi:hypothetical protein